MELPVRMTTSWGARRIEYMLHLERRRDLVIAVHPDLAVHVRAPVDRSIDRIVDRVEARRPWIMRQLKFFEAVPPLPAPRFISGETLFYRGRQYRLKVERRGVGVSITEGRLVVHVGRTVGVEAVRVVRKVLSEWYRDQAARFFPRRVVALQREISALRDVTTRLCVRRMSRRWGSCTAAGTISINPALIQTPVPCIDYVLVHELLHVIEPAHSARFYGLLDRAMPDWRDRRQRLSRAEVRWL
jgi:predicted metal-dependent hydrolase